MFIYFLSLVYNSCHDTTDEITWMAFVGVLSICQRTEYVDVNSFFLNDSVISTLFMSIHIQQNEARRKTISAASSASPPSPSQSTPHTFHLSPSPRQPP